MADRDRGRAEENWRERASDSLDRELDAALAKYAAVEPRAGLEERVVANLRAERARVRLQAWWRCSAMAALAAVVVVAVALASRSGWPTHPVVTNHHSVPTQAPKQPAAQVASNGDGNRVRPLPPGTVRNRTAPRPHPPVAVASQPKLALFPSPAPLSEQEKILKNYVAKYPQQAVLIARAANEALRRDQLEQMQAFASGEPATDSEQPNNDTTER
jgi:hypothetical protein